MYHLIGLASNWNATVQTNRMVEALKKLPGNLWESTHQRTFSPEEEQFYINTVVLLDNEMPSVSIRRWCKNQEKKLGRQYHTSICAADMDWLCSWEGRYVPCACFTSPYYYLPLIREVCSTWLPC